ncbi:hypothetical protein B0H10DRAFT_2446656 [Mycena sp. CBHHK59/15]|nr:hypothetical protein B0H10DRAFT_2446656 [Mycena sp. CBHHK59/15]
MPVPPPTSPSYQHPRRPSLADAAPPQPQLACPPSFPDDFCLLDLCLVLSSLHSLHPNALPPTPHTSTCPSLSSMPLTFTILPSTISPSSNHCVPATALSITMASAHGMLLLYPPRIYSPLSALDIRPCPCQRCEEQSALSFNPHHPFTPVYAGVHLEEIEVFTHRD